MNKCDTMKSASFNHKSASKLVNNNINKQQKTYSTYVSNPCLPTISKKFPKMMLPVVRPGICIQTSHL